MEDQAKYFCHTYYLKDDPQSWWQTNVNDIIIKALVKSNQRYTTWEIAETMNIHNLSIYDTGIRWDL